MLVDCDALSRYNTMTSAWRDALPENNTTTGPTIAASSPRHSHLTLSQHAPYIPQLPPIQLHGPPSRTSAMPASINPYIKRSLLTWNALGTPIYEAITSSGIPLDALLQLEDSIKTTNSPRSITSTDKFLNTISQHTPTGLRFDWFIGTCDVVPTLKKYPRTALKNWCARCLSILRTLRRQLQLGAAILIAPAALFPTIIQVWNPLWKADPIPSWHMSSNTLSGHDAGDPVTTTHHVIYLGPFHPGPTWSQTPSYTPMRQLLPPPNSSTVFFRLNNATLRHAGPLDQQVHQVDPAIISTFMRQNLDVPSKEYPLFKPSRPAPPILHPRPEETFFNGLFAIHLSSTVSKDERCRVIQLYDYAKLLGLDRLHTSTLPILPNPMLNQRLRTAAPRQALTILLRSLHSLEDEQKPRCSAVVPTSPHPTPHGVATDVFSAIALPTHHAWTAAIQQDEDLRKILRALNREAPIPLRSDLNEPIFLDLLHQRRLEADNGILYYFDNSKAREVQQL